MTPDFGIRLHSIARSLEYVILPALDASNSLAHEQLAIALGHLAVLQQQWQYQADYLAQCLAEMYPLGHALAKAAEGGSATDAARHALGAEIDRQPSTAPLFTATERHDVVAHAVDTLIIAGHRDGRDKFRRELRQLVLDHGARQSLRDRVWFAATGLDPARANFPEIRALVTARIAAS